MSQDDDLKAEEKLGQEAKAFVKSDLGRLFLGRASVEEEAAAHDLIDLNVYQHQTLEGLRDAVLTIQDRVRAGRMLKTYLQEAIIIGDQATHALSTSEE